MKRFEVNEGFHHCYELAFFKSELYSKEFEEEIDEVFSQPSGIQWFTFDEFDTAGEFAYNYVNHIPNTFKSLIILLDTFDEDWVCSESFTVFSASIIDINEDSENVNVPKQTYLQ